MSELSVEAAYSIFQLQKEVVNNTKSVTEEEMENGPREIFIDFRNNEKGGKRKHRRRMRGRGVQQEGEVIIKLKDMKKINEKVKERVKLTDKDHPNVLLIFLDTVSRQNFHRKYKKSTEFLRERHYSKKGKSRVYEFFRLHSIQPYTTPNLVASSYGTVEDVVKKHDKKLKKITQYYKEAGYITGFGGDLCSYIEGMELSSNI